MAPEAGTKLGSYEIVSPIGAGGMGEVYRARDTKLGREVAIKVLPDAFSQDSEKLARFKREAHLLASVNHPNIATLYGLEESDGQQFLVMELVEGETLGERLVRGPMPVEEALPLFQHIAEGLEAAHEKGIIHRDLKPSNIKISLDDRPKILDFGLAKAFSDEAPTAELSHSPTLTREGTRAGVIMGTAAYMSPEQARGKTLDKRTDIWAFGCVLFEALTGRKAFAGETVPDIFAAIVHKDPDWESLPAPGAKLQGLLGRCLAKDRRQRLHDIADARIEIEETMARPFEPPEVEGRSTSTTLHVWRAAMAWGAVAGVLVAAVAYWMGRNSIEIDRAFPAPTRFSIELSSDQRVAIDMDLLCLAISRDGQRLGWIGMGARERRIYTRTLDDLEVRGIAGTEGADNFNILFSPDGQWVAFSRNGALWKIPVGGGIATRLWEGESVSPFTLGDWTDDGAIVFGLLGSGLSRIPESGGEPETLTHYDRERGEVAHSTARVLPEGRGILFAVSVENWNDSHVEVLDLETGQRRVVIEHAFRAEYSPSGHLVFGRDGTVFAVPFDLERLEVTGPETPVLPDVQTDTLIGRFTEFVLSRSGTLAFIPGDQGFGERHLAWMSREGTKELFPTPPGTYSSSQLSPDGTQAAVSFHRGHVRHVALHDLSRGVLTQFTFEGSYNTRPVWSPDGSRIAFQSNRAGQSNLFVKPIKGDTPAAHLQESTNYQFPLSWSPDGRLLAYVERSVTDRFEVWLLPMDEKSSRPIPFLVGDVYAGWASFSPMGAWIAYVSAEEGQPEVFVREVALDRVSSGLKRKVSRDGGWEPKWSRDGRELFYRSRDGDRLLSVSVRTEPELAIGEEQVLLEDLSMPAPGPFTEGKYDVSPDGDRFLMVLEGDTPETMDLVVVVNWSEELERLVPIE